MQRDVAAAHAETLRDIAGQWERGSEQGDGGAEVAFLLRRAARHADKCAGIDSPEPVEQTLKVAQDIQELRD